MPKFVQPQLATLVERPPDGDGWLHELKHDGYRILARVEHRRAKLFSRNAHDWTEVPGRRGGGRAASRRRGDSRRRGHRAVARRHQ